MKKLQAAAEIVKKITNLKQLKDYGFVFKRRSSSCGGFWLHPKKKVVVKNSYIVAEKPINSVPTVELKFRYGFYESVLIQPLCKPLPRSNLSLIIVAEMERESDDCHSGNVMLYRGKPVHIDW